MLLYNKKKGYMANMDMVKDIFLGREPGTLAIGFKNGSATKLTVYSSEAEALEAINMIAERISTSTRAVICIPDEEEVRVHLRSGKQIYHHATGKETTGGINHDQRL